VLYASYKLVVRLFLNYPCNTDLREVTMLSWPLQLPQENLADFVYDWVRRHLEAAVRDSLYVDEFAATVPSPRSTA